MNAHDYFKGLMFLDPPSARDGGRGRSDFAPRYGNQLANSRALGPLTSPTATEPCCRRTPPTACCGEG